MKKHAVFTIGPTPAQVLKSAVMIEDTAKTYWLALQIGDPQILSKKYVERHKNWYRYFI